MMYWFVQGKMCSECDVFIIHQLRSLLLKAWPVTDIKSFLSFFCHRHWKTLTPCSSFGLTEPLMRVFKLLWIACFASFHIPSMLPVCTNSVLPSRLFFFKQKIPLLWLQRIVKYFGFSRQLWVAWCAIWHKTCLFAWDVIWKSSKRSNNKVWDVIWKSSKRSNKKVVDVVWKSSKRSNEKVWDVKKNNISKRSSKSVLDVVWKSSKHSSKKVWDVLRKSFTV